MIDIGVNLTSNAFDGDRDAVLDRAWAAGVAGIVITGTDVDGSGKAARLAANQPGRLWSTAGVHPHHARDWGPDTEAALRALCARREVVAIGECGLDFNRDYSPRPDQERAFEAQLALAAELEFPVFVHERDASARLIEILTPWRGRIPRAVVHCFTGDADTLRRYLDLDLHIGITGWICDERRGVHLRDLVPTIPAERLMIETDAPFLMPRTIRPRPRTRRNEPAWLGHVRDAVATARGEPAAAVATTTAATARSFFGLA